jgi:3-(3-hydroxy-phenyl)propionate hydroxylase
MRQDAIGIHGIGKLEDRGLARVVLTERQLMSAGQPTLQDISNALKSVFGSDFGIHSPAWISRFTDMTRQAAAYRERRVFLAGDAAHVHPPIGGQGLNIGVQDAVNLGWKLAQVIKGMSPDSLLDTYHAERHPVAARALQSTMATVALRRSDDRSKALGEIVSELFVLDEPRKRLVGRMSGLDIHYDSGEGHPLLGRRIPDLDLMTANGPVRMFNLLHRARPVLLALHNSAVLSRGAEPCNQGGFDIAPWAGRVQVVHAQYQGPWELPVLGAVAAPTGVLIRPDGHVAWVGERIDSGLTEALTTWFGPPIAG